MTDRRTGTPTAVLDRQAARSPVDPRLRARRIEVRRREGRQRLRRLVIALVVTICCAAVWGLTRSPLLDVDHIEIGGVTRVTAADVAAAAGIERGDPLVDLDLGAAGRAISSLPWVSSADVSRSWSGTVTYTVTERVPVAVFTDQTGAGVLVDGTGWVVAPAGPTDVEQLVRVEGVEPPAVGEQLVAEQLPVVALAGAITPGLATWVDAIEVAADGELWMRVRLGVGGTDAERPARIRFGDAREVDAQVVAAQTVLARVELECLAVVDVRIASTSFVTRHPDCGAGS